MIARMLTGLTLALIGVMATAQPMMAKAEMFDLEKKLRVGALIYEDLVRAGGAPPNLIAKSICVAVVPNLLKGAFGVGGRYGKGVMSCRRGENEWSPPAFIKITGVSIGLQIGGVSSDLVLFFPNERGVRLLTKGNITMGVDANVAAGPWGREAGASTNISFKAAIYSYAKSEGLFVGVALDGSRLSIDQKSIKTFYGERLWPEDILFEHEVPSVSREAQMFIDAVAGTDSSPVAD